MKIHLRNLLLNLCRYRYYFLFNAILLVGLDFLLFNGQEPNYSGSLYAACFNFLITLGLEGAHRYFKKIQLAIANSFKKIYSF